MCRVTNKTRKRRTPHEQRRVRLLIAIPVLFVLLLSTMGGLLYQLVDIDAVGASTTVPPLAVFARNWLVVMIMFDFLGAAVGIYLAHSITSPLRTIMNISEKVAGGDFSETARINRADEVGDLGHSFNYMVESLNKSITMRNRFILESFSGGLIATDMNGTITVINSAAERILGVSASGVAGKPARQVFSKHGTESLLALIEEALWKHEPIVSRRISVSADTSTTVLIVNSSTICDGNGNLFGVVVNFRDSAAFQRFYEQMNREDRLAAIGTFATGLAHEIRNPLGAIKGTAQLLAEDVKSNPRSLDYTKIIVKEVNRLDSLVREVQEFSQPSATPRRPSDLNKVVQDTVGLARNSSKAALRDNVQVKEIYGELPRTYLSQDKITQALLNIIINAFQATPPNGTITVKTAILQSDRLPLHIEIANTGSCIPTDQLNKIFEPFYTTKDQGTGLGLSIAYQIISNHGGEIEVATEHDTVTFKVNLPLSVSEEEARL